MKVGFDYDGRIAAQRAAIFGEQASRRVGYVEHDGHKIWFCDAMGRRVARVIRYKPHQAPQPSVHSLTAYPVQPYKSNGDFE
jgi:hypothetical protein